MGTLLKDEQETIKLKWLDSNLSNYLERIDGMAG